MTTLSAQSYKGRFAPSPTGPLHAGSLVAALASWLDARAHGGQWCVRMEDVDRTRCKPHWAQEILRQLAALGLLSDVPVVYQTARDELYEQTLQTLRQAGAVYPCSCSRRTVQLDEQGVYAGTCQGKSLNDLAPGTPFAWRFRAPPQAIAWEDRRLGWQTGHLAQTLGDFVLKRSDGLFAYQLAVVVDDAQQGITHVVRGEDMLENTARQIALQQALGFARPQYLHVPLQVAQDGRKLSKQNGAAPLELAQPLRILNRAAMRLGLRPQEEGENTAIADALAWWIRQWGASHAVGTESGHTA